MAELKLVTLTAPKLASKDFYPAAIAMFVGDWNKYVTRVALIPGLVPQPMDLCIERELLDSWVDMGRIPDESPQSILAFLTAQSVLDPPLVDVRTVFTSAVLSAAFNPALEPDARVQSLFTCVMKLIRAKNLKTYLLRKSNLKEVQHLILDAIQPADAAAVIRLKIKSREIPFTMLELSDEILTIIKYEDQKKGINQAQNALMAPISDASAAAKVHVGFIPTPLPTFNPPRAVATTTATTSLAAPSVEKPLMDRGGKPVKCYGCGGNHWVQQCPAKTPTEKAQLLADAASLNAARGWTRNAEGRLVKSTTPAATTTPATTNTPSTTNNTTAPVAAKQNTFQTDPDGLEIADALLGNRITSSVMIDCGANYPAISASLVRCLEVLKGNNYNLNYNIPPHLKHITLGDNETVVAVEGLYTSTLQFIDCRPITITFLVVNMDLPHIILGNNTLREYGVNVKELFLRTLSLNQLDTPPVVSPTISLEPAKLSMFAVGSGFDPQPFRYEPNRAADELAPDMMESVLLQSLESEVVELPSLDTLFPIKNNLSISEQAILQSFYERLPSLLYQGSEPYVGAPFKIDLVPDAIPHRCKNRGLSPPVRKFLETCRESWLANNYISPIGHDVEWCSFVFAVPKPGAEGYRAVVDYVGLNKQTRSSTYPMPFLDSALDKMAGSKYFGILDLLKGYRQCSTDLQSGNYLAIMLLDQIYRVDRLFEGAKNAVAYFQALFNSTLQKPLSAEQRFEISTRMPPDSKGGFEYNEDAELLRIWIDDSLLHNESFISFLHLLERVLIRLRDARLRLNLNKSILCADRVVHVGREYSVDGIRLDPARVLDLLNIPLPLTGSDLMYFLNSLNWNRMCIPHYTELAAPLYALLQQITEEAGTRKKRPASRILLDNRWSNEHTASFETLKTVLSRQVLVAFPKVDHSLFLFTDASDVHHAAVLMQCESCELHKPLHERHFEPLGFCCGTFRDASRNWDIQSKEGYALLHGLDKFRYLIYKKVSLVIDHNNFTYLFASTEPHVDKITQRRILRWRQTLGQWDYDVIFIPGSLIPWVDYLTRGGSTTEDLQPIVTSITPVFNAMHLINSTSDETFVWPSLLSPHVLAAHAAYDPTEDPWFVNQGFFMTDGIYYTDRGIAFVPTRELQICVLVAAHSGAAMHRGIPMMKKCLVDTFIWETMMDDVTTFVDQCIHCLISKEGVKVPRPWGNVLRGTKPNEVIHLDFVTLLGGSKKKEGKKAECCHIVDSFSSYHSLYSTHSTTAVEAALALQQWIVSFGFPKWIISDQGSAFVSELFQEVVRLFKVQHHMVVAHTHTGNGKVERAHRTFLAMLRALLSELRVPVEDWEELLPLIQHGINNTPSANLAGKAPIEVFLGLPRNDPLDGLLVQNKALSIDTARSEGFGEIFKELLLDYMLGRDDDRAHLIEIVNDSVKRRRLVNDVYNRKHFKPEIPNFSIGSFVMVSSVGHVPKLVSNWTGPYRVDSIINSYIYKVNDLIKTNHFITVHAARLLTFRNDFLHTDIGVKEQAAYFKTGFEVNVILDCRQVGKQFEVLINWLGFDTMDNTWEDALSVWESASDSMTTFIVSMTDKIRARSLCKFLVVDYNLILQEKNMGKPM